MIQITILKLNGVLCIVTDIHETRQNLTKMILQSSSVHGVAASASNHTARTVLVLHPAIDLCLLAALSNMWLTTSTALWSKHANSKNSMAVSAKPEIKAAFTVFIFVGTVEC